MTIIVEDGTGVLGANSFVGLAEVSAIASERGIVLPTAPAELEVLSVKSMDYLALQEDNMQGSRSSSTQSLMFPRFPVYIHGRLVEADEIPSELILLQSLLMIALTSMELMPNIPAGSPSVIKFRAGPVEQEVAQDSRILPILVHANRMLRLLSGSGSRIVSRRG